MSNDPDDFMGQVARSVATEAALADEERRRKAGEQRALDLMQLISTPAGQRELLNELQEVLPIGQEIFEGNSKSYKTLADIERILKRLHNLRIAYEHCERGDVAFIDTVLRSWFLGTEIH